MDCQVARIFLQLRNLEPDSSLRVLCRPFRTWTNRIFFLTMAMDLWNSPPKTVCTQLLSTFGIKRSIEISKETRLAVSFLTGRTSSQYYSIYPCGHFLFFLWCTLRNCSIQFLFCLNIACAKIIVAFKNRIQF